MIAIALLVQAVSQHQEDLKVKLFLVDRFVGANAILKIE